MLRALLEIRINTNEESRSLHCFEIFSFTSTAPVYRVCSQSQALETVHPKQSSPVPYMACGDVTGIWVPHLRVYCLQHSGFDDAGKEHKILLCRHATNDKVKVKDDHRSKFSNLSNWKEEAWKNQGFNGIRTCDLRDTGALLYQLSYEATHWERG